MPYTEHLHAERLQAIPRPLSSLPNAPTASDGHFPTLTRFSVSRHSSQLTSRNRQYSRLDAHGKMNGFTWPEIADIHFVYGAAEGNSREAQRMYEERYPGRAVPDRRMFDRVHRLLGEGNLGVSCKTSLLSRLANGQGVHRNEVKLIAHGVA